MNPLTAIAQANAGFLLLIATTITWYVATRAALDALSPARALAPLPRAIAHWMPIAVLALYCVCSKRPEVAVTVLFATSVAALSLVLGILILTGTSVDAGHDARRPWALIAPVALLTFLAGFKGHFTLTHALIFLVEGAVVAYLMAVPAPTNGAQRVTIGPPRETGLRALQFVLAVAVALLGAWLGAVTTDRMASTAHFLMPGFVSAAMLSPALMLPMIGTGSELVHEGRFQTAVSSLVGVVLLNLCLLLPILIIASLIVTARENMTLNVPFTTALLNAPPLFFPMSSWRIDNVFLIVLGLALLPISIGRWTLSRGEGFFVLLVYAFYLALVARVAVM
jgi:hypothetical protein